MRPDLDVVAGSYNGTFAFFEDVGSATAPTLVLPNGLVMPGFKTADELLRRIREELVASRREK